MSEAQRGRLEAIWIKTARRGSMQPVDNADLVADRGLVGNVDQGGRRQVTLLQREAWERALASLGASVDPSRRRANLFVSGLDLADSGDRVVRVGDCRIRIVGETHPCDRMDQAYRGLQKALEADWGGGAYGVVLDDGPIAVGDTVSWSE
jgi:MOSC domain-containing protein YiiM